MTGPVRDTRVDPALALCLEGTAAFYDTQNSSIICPHRVRIQQQVCPVPNDADRHNAPIQHGTAFRAKGKGPRATVRSRKRTTETVTSSGCEGIGRPRTAVVVPRSKSLA